MTTLLKTALRRRAKATLRRGGVLAYATESCYGLGCDPRRADALRRIIRLKGRPNHKGMIVVAANLAQLQPLLRPLSAADKQRLAEYWPGPNTLLLPASRRVLPLLRGRGRDKIAVRITAHRETAELCRALGMALVSTSANLAKRRALKNARDCRRLFGGKALTLPGRIGRRKTPSTIIDFASGRRLR